MKLSQLRVLVAVANHSNFSEAALDLGMSQSAVSHAIASLEAELGVPLFSRGRYGAHPTPVGERVVNYARQVQQLTEEITKEANLAKGLHGGQVRVASFRSVATHILPEAIAQFRRCFPAIEVSITEHEDYPDVEQSLREGQADIGFTYLPAKAEFETWELLQDEFVALFPKTFRQTTAGTPAPGGRLSWEELANYPLIMPPDNDITTLQVYTHCLLFSKQLNIAYRVKTDSTIVSMVAQGLGATILPRLAAEPIPASVQIYSLPEPLFRVIGVAVLTDALLVPAVFAFLDILKHRDKSIDKATN